MPSLRSSAAGDNDVRIKVSTTADNSGTEEAKAGLKSVGAQADDTGNRFASMSTAAKVAVAAIAASVVAVGKTFVQSAADLQQTSKSFEVLTGNVEVANGLFAQLATYANTTPFEFPDIAKAGQTLLGFGIQSDKVFDKIKVLGDLAAATGANFSSLAVVFGQVNATGKLMGGDALQLVNNSIPIYNMLAKQMGIETGKVKEKIEQGAVSVEIFNDALSNATKEGGFAFKGVDTLASSFNGRMSTLNDAMLDFGRNLLGVKVDNKLGLVIQEGGLFDNFSKMLPVISSGLSSMIPFFSAGINALMDFAKSIGEIVLQAGTYLMPKLQELWSAISDNLIPILTDLWHNVIEPLAPVIGTVLVGAIGLAVDILTGLVDIVGSVYQAFMDGNPVILGLAGVFGTLAAAMALNSAFTALQAGFAVLTTVTIPSVTAAFGGLATLIATPIVMPALVIGAAIASIAAVWNAYNEAMSAMDQADRAREQDLKASKDLMAVAKRQHDAGKIDDTEFRRLVGVAARANGGPVQAGQAYAVGDNPDGSWNDTTELFVPNQSGTIVSSQKIRQAMSGSQDTNNKGMGNNTQTFHIGQIVLASDSAVNAFFDHTDRDAQAVAMNLTPARGQ